MDTANQISANEKRLLALLSAALRKECQSTDAEEKDYRDILAMARVQGITPLLFDAIADADVPASFRIPILQSARVCAHRAYTLLYENYRLTEALLSRGITPITLKGAATASLYPTREFRKYGDIDLFLAKEEDFAAATDILKELSYVEEEAQPALHHLALRHTEGFLVELHNLLVEPFANETVNQYLAEIGRTFPEHTEENTAWGVRIYSLTDGYHAFYLMLHMLQHYMRRGFGLRNLCDWVVFWNRDIAPEECEIFRTLVQKSGTAGFVSCISLVCIRYLQMSDRYQDLLITSPVTDEDAAELLREILDGAEFGNEDSSRMVTLTGGHLTDYIREFHHQTKLSYPRASRLILTYPVLWCLTLLRFLKNNRTVRNQSASTFLVSAKKRSKLTEHMRLFQ